MKLFYAPGACSLAAHITACEAGIGLELVKVDLAAHTLPDGADFRAVNPRGYVPALKFGDEAVLTEVSAILQFLGDIEPSHGLTPPLGSMERVRLQEWLSFIATELHKPLGQLWSRETPEATKSSQQERILMRLNELERVLKERPFLMGASFTVADAYAFTVVSWCNMLNLSLQQHPATGAYLARVSGRPAVQKALMREGLLKATA